MRPRRCVASTGAALTAMLKGATGGLSKPKHVLQRGLRAKPIGQPGEPVAARAVRMMRTGHAHDDVGIGREAGNVGPDGRAHDAATERGREGLRTAFLETIRFLSFHFRSITLIP
jgi:hypothetical protein